MVNGLKISFFTVWTRAQQLPILINKEKQSEIRITVNSL